MHLMALLCAPLDQVLSFITLGEYSMSFDPVLTVQECLYWLILTTIVIEKKKIKEKIRNDLANDLAFFEIRGDAPDTFQFHILLSKIFLRQNKVDP